MKGKLLVISGLSGAGKGTVVNELMSRFNNKFVLSISATTRDKRDGEVDGINYFFVDKNKFEEMIDNSELIEYAKYVDNYYGTPKKYVIDRLDEGKNVILEIEMQGALKIKEIFNDAILVFLLPKDAKTLRYRLINRGRETEEQVNQRLKQAIVDADYAKSYDYVIINDIMDDTINCIKSILQNEYSEYSKYSIEIKNRNLLVLDKLVKDIKEENYV